MKRKMIAGLLIFAMLFTFVPTVAFADTGTGGSLTVLNVSYGNITIGEGTLSAFDENGNEIITPNPYGYIITGDNSSENDKRVTITSGSHNITIRDLSITVNDFSDGAAFCMSGGGTLNLTLEGTNTLHSGAGKAGLNMENGSSLVITTASDNVGTLNAEGGSFAPGIGGSQGGKCGDISIEGGNFCIAAGGAHDITIGAGASDYAECGTVSITGGHFAEGSVTENKIYGIEVPAGNYVIHDGTTSFPYTVTTVKPDNHDKDGKLTILDISKGDIIIGDGTLQAKGSQGNALTTYDADGFKIVGTTTTNTVSITGGSHKITIDNLSIDVSNKVVNSYTYFPAFNMAGGSLLELTLSGTNTLSSGEHFAGLNLAEGSSLTITAESGSNTLNANGGYEAPGIGSERGKSCGDIFIEGGHIIAKAGAFSTSIGAGNNGNCANITITGGTVEAMGCEYTYGTTTKYVYGGIGNVYTSEASYGRCGTISISGGTVKADRIGSNPQYELVDTQIRKCYETVINISGGNIEVTEGKLGYKEEEFNNPPLSEGSINVTITGGNFASGVEATDSDNGKVYDNVVASCHKVVKNNTGDYPYAVVEGEHTASQWITTTTTHKQVCDSCKVIIVAEEAHDWNEHACSECGYTCDHTGGTATCQAKAVCEKCNAEYGELNVVNHVSNEFTYISNQNGTHKKTHACCNVAVVENEECSGGTATCTAKAVCEKCTTEYGTTAEHDYSIATCLAKATCKVCNATTGEFGSHTEVTDAAVAATCTATGLTEGKHCSVCGTVTVEQQEVAKLSHTEVIDAAKDATCKETGLTEGKHCSVCGTVTVEPQEVAILPHTEVTDAAKAATCTETGLIEGKHCSVCGTVTVEQQEIAKLPHTEVTDAAVAATCTETGLTEGKHCSVCDEVLVAQSVVEKAAHTYNDNNVCTVCGDKKASTSTTTTSTGGGFSGSYNYPVSTTDVAGATVTFSDNNAVAGETVTITVTPDSGKQVAEVIVTDADGDVITVTKVGDNQYTFTMPAGKVNVSVTTETIDYDNKIVLQIGNKNVVVDGKPFANDVAPLLQGDRTLVPIRVIVEALGGSVDWNEATRTVTITIDGKVLTLVIDQPIPGFGQGAIIMDSRTYVPIRYVAEYVGANVEWIAATQQIVILK